MVEPSKLPVKTESKSHVLVGGAQALQPDERYLAAEMHRQLHEIERRRHAYLGGRKPLPVKGRLIVLVDDGIATAGGVPSKRMCPRRLETDLRTINAPGPARRLVRR